MSLEPCPFCGKPFKRLKSHLPHCKMSPGSMTTEGNTGPKEILAATAKDTTRKHQKNKASVFKENLTESSSLKTPGKSNIKAEKASVDEDPLAQVPSAERGDTHTVKPKSKWLTKREQEMMKIRTTLLTQKGSKSTSNSQKEKDNCSKSETSKGQVKGTLQIERKSAQGQNLKKPIETSLTSLVSTTTSSISATDLLQIPWTTDSQAKPSRPLKLKPNSNKKETKNSPKNSIKDLLLVPRVKEQEDLFPLFQTKTCVWEHIKYGLYSRRLNSVPVLHITEPIEKVCIPKCGNSSVSVHKYPTENKMVTSPSSSSSSSSSSSAALLALGPTSAQRLVMEWSPEMITDHSKPPQSGISSNEGLLTKHQYSSFSPENPDPGTVQRLRDVKLCELAAWLCIRTPKSPRESVTMFHRGWQWYYRKYIDVQKGGIGGISMLIAGYCVLSYIWSYPHLKKERWRKYH